MDQRPLPSALVEVGGVAREACETEVVWHSTLRASGDESAAAWLAARLSGEPGTVTGSVPDGYAAYARILHPSEHDDRWWSWSEVVEGTGRQAHALMQWHALVGSSDSLNASGSLWPGGNPQRGHLQPNLLAALCDLLCGFTAKPERCFFCLWEGYGWESSGDHVIAVAPGTEIDVDALRAELASQALSEEELRAVRVELPGRNYLLFEGSLRALARSLSAGLDRGGWVVSEFLWQQSPNLFWPADHAWCVASEIDFDSTLVGGSSEVIDAIIRSPILEAWPVESGDWLTADADRINVVPAR